MKTEPIVRPWKTREELLQQTSDQLFAFAEDVYNGRKLSRNEMYDILIEVAQWYVSRHVRLPKQQEVGT